MADEPAAPRDNWEAHWARFAQSATGNPAQRMRHEIIGQLLAEKAGSGAIRLFDFGSGQGDLVKKLSAMFPNAEFVGAELSNSGVAISQQKVPGATFVVADIFEAPAVLKNFAGWASHAVCSEVLEHVDEPAVFLKQAREYLAPGAQMIVTVPGGPISAFDREIGHRQHFNRAKIRSLLEQAGYLVERTCLAGFPFFNLYRLLVLMRGRRLARDIEATAVGQPSGLLRFAMKLFRVLFHANLLDSPFGWQVVAIARKPWP